MKKIVSSRQMKRWDKYTIEVMGVPSMVLMERAALSVVDEMTKSREELGKILVVCGTGNNGGDGFAIGRLLHLKGCAVSLYPLGNPSKYTEETRAQKKIGDNYGVPVTNNPQWHEYTTIVDAIFGIGLDRPVTGEYLQVIENINKCKANVWAVDIPSGIHGDTGEILGQGVQADHTVTFAWGKAGLYLYPGASCSGEIHVVDIGICSPAEKQKEELTLLSMEPEDLKRLPKRAPDGNKGTFGKVLVVAGCETMCGAAYFSARAALATGAGMVMIHTVMDNRTALQQLLPEALLAIDSTDSWDTKEWQKHLEWCDTIVLGPGLGQGDRCLALTKFYLSQTKVPVVADADALNCISYHQELFPLLNERTIITPHLGEMSRLTGEAVSEIKRDICQKTRTFADTWHTTCVAKDARTVTATAEGDNYINLSGNSGMGTAGSGDVLSGIIGGLMAQGCPCSEAAPLGVYLHGMAGDEAKNDHGCISMTATHILEGLETVLKRKV